MDGSNRPLHVLVGAQGYPHLSRSQTWAPEVREACCVLTGTFDKLFRLFFLKSHGWKTPQRYLMGEEKGPAESKSPESRTHLEAHFLGCSQAPAAPWLRGGPPSGWSLPSQGPSAQPYNWQSSFLQDSAPPITPPTWSPSVFTAHPSCAQINPPYTPVSHFAYGRRKLREGE